MTIGSRRALRALLLAATVAGCGTAPPSKAPAASVASSVGPSASVFPEVTATSTATPTVAAPTASPAPTAGPVRTIPPSASPSPRAAIPDFRHIYVLVMENHEYDSIVGDPQAPYINTLIARFGLATDYRAVAHPSEPNYLALFGGSTFDVHDDGAYDLPGANLADQLVAHGRTWHVYAQNVPGGCSRVTSARGGVDLIGEPGAYARKHEPAISFTDISGDPAACAHITRLAGFDPGAADFELIVPNQTNDMHDGTIAQGDAFLEAMVPLITKGPEFAGSLLVITWDEGSSSLGGGGHVATIVVSDRVPAGVRSSIVHDHYSLLATIEAAWGLGCLRKACQANDLREFFRP